MIGTLAGMDHHIKQSMGIQANMPTAKVGGTAGRNRTGKWGGPQI